MIYIVIFFLLLILVFLFTDWTGLQRRFKGRLPQLPGLPRIARTAKPKKEPLVPRPINGPAAMTSKFKPRDSFDAAFHEAEQQMSAAAEIPEDEAPSSRPLDSEVERLLAEADIHFRKGEMKAAENLYVQAASKDPLCGKAYSRLGVIYLEQGDNYDDAEAAFRQALKSEPQNGFILNNLGLVLYHQDKYADAIRHFELAVRQDEFNAARHANLGMAYMAMRQYAKAESSFKKALKLAPSEMEYKDLLNESIEKKKAHKTMIRR